MSFYSVIVYSHHGVNKDKLPLQFPTGGWVSAQFICCCLLVTAYQCINPWDTARHYCSARV